MHACRWYYECGVGEFGVSERSLLLTYYLGSASIFEAERSTERMAWVKTAALMDSVRSYFSSKQISAEDKTAFLRQFTHSSTTLNSR